MPVSPPDCDPNIDKLARTQIDNIGDKEDKTLSPLKLAAFYKAVGADYDCKYIHALGTRSLKIYS